MGRAIDLRARQEDFQQPEVDRIGKPVEPGSLEPISGNPDDDAVGIIRFLGEYWNAVGRIPSGFEHHNDVADRLFQAAGDGNLEPKRSGQAKITEARYLGLDAPEEGEAAVRRSVVDEDQLVVAEMALHDGVELA